MTETTQKKAYYPELDIIKGIAILLVIYGHSFCYFPINIRDMLPAFAYDCVTKFHMQLFFIASGFLYTTKETWTTFLKKKSVRILIPYIVFCIFYHVLHLIASSFTRSHTEENLLLSIINGTHYWFLHALFFIYIIIRFANGKRWIYFILMLASISFHLLIPKGEWEEILGSGHIIYFLNWFIVGIFMRDIYNQINVYMDKWWITIVLVLLCIVSFMGLNKVSFITWYIYPLVCSLFVWSISRILLKTKLPQSGLSYFGKYSLQFYINHMLISLGAYYVPFLLNITNPFISFGIIFITQLLIAWIMLLVENTNDITRFFTGLALKKIKL